MAIVTRNAPSRNPTTKARKVARRTARICRRDSETPRLRDTETPRLRDSEKDMVSFLCVSESLRPDLRALHQAKVAITGAWSLVPISFCTTQAVARAASGSLANT